MANRDIIVSVNVIRRDACLVVQTQTIKKELPYVQVGNVVTIVGKDGSLIYSAAGVPSNSLGVYTDLYIDTVAPNNFYQKNESNVWILKGSLKGIKGDDGREVLIQNNGTYIQWQYEGDTEWTNIVELSTLKGDTGSNIELNKSATHIQWRVVGDTNWIDLVALSELKGEDGYTPIKGVDYFDGRGIVSIIKTSTVGLVDTYTITYSDTTTSTFDVTNADTSTLLKLDQTTPQTLTQSPKINDLVAGQMCYVDANKQLKPIDVFWDNVNKRMGIRVSSPLYTIDALGSVKVSSQFIVDTSALTRSELYSSTYDFSFTCFLSGSVRTNMRLLRTGELGIGTTTPKSKLQVVGGIQCGDDTAAASADKVGTTRYRATANASYAEMCVQTGADTFQWQTILTNTW